MLDSDAESAKTLTLVAIILQAVFTMIFIFIFLAFALAFSSFTPVPVGTTGTTTVTTTYFGLGSIFIIFAVFGSIGLIWVFLDYFLVYSPISKGDIQRSETSALILSILQILFGGVIPGILLLVAWVKIKDSMKRQERNQAAFM